MRRSKKSGPSSLSFDGALNGPLFESNPLPMWIYDRESFQFLAVNKMVVSKYGYSMAELLKMKVSDIRPAEDVSRFIEAASEVKGSVFQSQGEWRHNLKNGDIIDVEIHATEITQHGRKAILSIIHDISHLKKVESNLTAALERQGLIFEGSQDAIFISNSESRFISVNKAACELTGYTKSELLKMRIPDLHEDVDLEAYEEFHDKIMAGEPALTEALLLRKDGTKIPVEFNNRRMILSGTSYMHTTARDITARKTIEENLKLYELLFKNLSEIVLVIRSKDQRIIEANDAAVIAFQYTRDELLSMAIHDLRTPEERVFIPQQFSQKTSEEVSYETVNRRKDGSTFHAEVKLKPLTLNGEEIIVGIARDLTERERAEAALRRSETKYRDLVDTMPDGYYLSTSSGKFVEVNPAFCKMLGYSKDEMLAMNIPQTLYFAPSERAGESRFNGFSPTAEVYRLKRKDGLEAWFEDNARYIRDEAGKIMYHEGICRDITDRKRAEEALRESEENFRTTFEQAAVGMAEVAMDGKWLRVNDRLTHILAYSREELLTMKFQDLTHPDDLREDMEGFRHLLTGEIRTISWEKRSVRKDELIVWLNITASVHRNVAGTIDYLIVVIEDISARKQAEENLRQSEMKYRDLFNNAEVGMFRTKLDGSTILDFNEKYLSIFGRTREEMMGSQTVNHWADPHEREEMVRRLKIDGYVTDYECKMLTKKGEVRNCLASVKLYPEQGVLEGSILDITERKQAQVRLANALNYVQTIFENSPIGMITFKATGEVVSVNPLLARIAGGTIEKIQAQNFRKLESWYSSGMLHTANAALASGVEKRIETHTVTTFGKDIWASCLFVPFFYEGEQYLLLMINEITEQKRSEEALRQSNTFNEMLLETMPFGIDIVDSNGIILFMNNNMKNLIGTNSVGQRCWIVYKDDKTQCENCPLIQETESNDTVIREVKGVLGGKTFQISHKEMLYQGKRAMLEIFQDVTEQKLLQEQLMQSQKLESIGQLAGGVAHDYNNILGVIIGYAELLRMKFKGEYENEKPVEAILSAANRGADLTRQLLAFARKETISPKVVNINTSIESIEKMLRRIIGENIRLLFRPAESLWNVKIDPSQLDQLLVNLATNSRDAIKDIGTIEIATGNVSLDEAFVSAHADLATGEFVKLSFSDNGIGMDEGTAKRVFEPFFTTKEKGQGTGLGLSTVYGIVKQNKGYILVASELGKGTAFEIFLPRSFEEIDITQSELPDILVNGTETILVVEDQTDILELTKASLEKYGFHVLTSLEPDEALRLCESYDGAIHLLLTDVIMPEMSGKSLSERVRLLRPAIKTLFMSGYTSNELGPEGILGEEVAFVQKPFTPAEIAKRVSEVLRT